MKYVITLAGHSICQIDAPNDQQAEQKAEGAVLGFLTDVFGEIAKLQIGTSEIAQREKVQSLLETAFPGFLLRCDFDMPRKAAGTNAYTPINVTLRAS